MRTVVCLVVVLASTATVALAAAQAPRLRIVTAAPLTIRGDRFYPRERVRLSVTLGSTAAARSPVTTATGSFRVVFPKLTLDRCSKRLQVKAVGAHGDRSAFTLETLECPDGRMDAG